MTNAKWINAGEQKHSDCPVFEKKFSTKRNIASAILKISSRGVYEAKINNKRVGSFVMAPGWTEYETRIQYQEYDISDLLESDNTIDITVASGWYSGRIATGEVYWRQYDSESDKRREAVIAEITVTYDDKTVEKTVTDESWKVGYGPLKFCDIYDGEIYDANIVPQFDRHACADENQNKACLIQQQGEQITEHERIRPVELIVTPKGEKVLDFGQNLTGYPEIKINAKKGESIKFSFAEILDSDGNFYNDNYRSAKCYYHYICKDGFQTHKPTHTFYGFRYLRIDEYPDAEIDLENFTAVVVHSDIKRTGFFESSDKMLGQLFHNIIWGQKSNYLDVPTDCPQRDERMGYTGDAQVFVRTASYNFDVEKFFIKWFNDMKISQLPDGGVPGIVPLLYKCECVSAGWGDAVTICPWEMYLTYGNKDILSLMYPSMEKWVNYITGVTPKIGLWTDHFQFGDWLELVEEGKDATRKDVAATCYYAYSAMLTYKAGKALGKDSGKYLDLYKRIKEKFISEYEDTLRTQTELVLAVYFGLTDRPEELVKKLSEMIISDGKMMRTGFLGTPYILHVLTDFGYTDLAYDLLLRKEYPSWLYPITKGATTMWEHWDGIKPDGSIWSEEMNSYNHYAYGAVGDWLYGKAAGINRLEDYPGFERALFTPHATDKIDRLFASLETRHGKITSGWFHENGSVIYSITTPVPAQAVINGKTYDLKIGENTIS